MKLVFQTNAFFGVYMGASHIELSFVVRARCRIRGSVTFSNMATSAIPPAPKN